ncbi:unnamed protein product [Timema podura]|uniref:Hydroxylysine kinase n=1 Tax=Timema podura TaxID=61482 RepID=A0ABN7NIA2_TIMPD|nr:unnamed protein product [Timema podura]
MVCMQKVYSSLKTQIIRRNYRIQKVGSVPKTLQPPHPEGWDDPIRPDIQGGENPPLPVTHGLDRHRETTCLPPIQDGNRSHLLPLTDATLRSPLLPVCWGMGLRPLLAPELYNGSLHDRQGLGPKAQNPDSRGPRSPDHSANSITRRQLNHFNPTHFWAATPSNLVTWAFGPALCATYNESSQTEAYQSIGPPQAPVGMGKIIYKRGVHTLTRRRVAGHKENTTLSTIYWNSNSNRTNTSSPVYCESNALDYSATEAGSNGINCPKPVKNVDGLYYSVEKLPQNGDDSSTSDHVVRLLTYQPGSVFQRVLHSRELFFSAGQFVAKLDQTLKSAEDGEIPVGRTAGLIHGDFNEQNILVSSTGEDDPWQITAILDFGDTHISCYLFELAITLCYMMLLTCEGMDPLDVGAHVLAGYSTVRVVPVTELQSLKTCICARLCQSLVMGEYSYLQDPGNDYLLTTAKTGWGLLQTLWGTGQDELEQRWRTSELPGEHTIVTPPLPPSLFSHGEYVIVRTTRRAYHRDTSSTSFLILLTFVLAPLVDSSDATGDKSRQPLLTPVPIVGVRDPNLGRDITSRLDLSSQDEIRSNNSGSLIRASPIGANTSGSLLNTSKTGWTF